MELLPEAVRRFVQPDAPGPARMMASRGMVPLSGPDLIIVLVQLAHDGDEAIAASARSTLAQMPASVVEGGVEGLTIAAILDGAASILMERESVIEKIVANAKTDSITIAYIARGCTERIGEIISVNEQRILSAPAILESLYRNKRVRMSTVDRLVELASRHGIDLPNIPGFKDHAEALTGQLIPEPSDEPLPSDLMFTEALAADSSDTDVTERDLTDDSKAESIRDRFKPLAFRIREMTTSEKIRFAVVGDAAARAMLVRDPKKAVYYAAISSPGMNDTEAAAIAQSKDVAIDVLRYIGGRKEWLGSYDIKKTLTFNPKTPIDISMRFLSHLRPNDLKTLSQSRGVANQLKVIARQRLEAAEKKG